MKRHDANIILVSAAAFGGGTAAAVLPAEVLPALGDATRLVVPAAVAALSGGLAALFSPWQRRRGAQIQKDQSMGFMTSKFVGLFRKGARQIEAEAAIAEMGEPPVDLAPVVRRSDAHPDAPPRAPLVVSRDLPGEAACILGEEPRGPIVEDITGLAMPRVPEPLPWDAIESEMNRLLGGVQFRSLDEAAPVPEEPVREPSIAELTERLERGLARRRGLDPEHVIEGHEAAEQAMAVSPVPLPITEPTGAEPEEDAAAPARSEDLDHALAALRMLAAKAS